MKFTLLALAACLSYVTAARTMEVTPTQTFFVPMPEYDVFHQTFKAINSRASGQVNSIVALAVSVDDTVVWIDHHEDGFEADYKDGTSFSSTTEVWGDGDCSNGYAFGTTCNSDSDDRLTAGQSIVCENKIKVDGSGNGNNKFDGGDKILASFPIAMTRGEYPDSPGSLMAGGVEVLETGEWGTHFVSPVGDQTTASSTGAFKHTALYVMAKEDGTNLVFTDAAGTSITLDAGESHTHIVKYQGETLTASKPVQVDLITGEPGSKYELRWFSLLPKDDWANSYFSPVGDTAGELKIYLYNPNTSSLTVSVETTGGTTTESVPAGGSLFTDTIPDGTGVALSASKKFIALSLTDTEGSGQIQDWGFPVLPTNKLTEEVLVGWGYGCTGKNCASKNNEGDKARSVVWCSPVTAADIYIDIDNDGIPETSRTVYNAARLSSNIFENDEDISGAVIWAVKPGKDYDSMETVQIAAAWGQKAGFSFSGDNYALDLGTLVPPFFGLRVNEEVALAIDNDGDGKISPGDVVTYTITVKNAGQRTYRAESCDYAIKNPGLPANLPRQTYVDNTCVFINAGNELACDDGALNGGDGLCTLADLPKRGGVHVYQFNAVVGPPSVIDIAEISNEGVLVQPENFGPILPFSAPELVHFNPSVTIEKTVHEGWLSGDLTTSCFNGAEIEEGLLDDEVTYCLKVKNTGNSYLANVVVTDPENGMEPVDTIPFLAPGDVAWVGFKTTITGDVNTDAKVTAEPRLVTEEEIPTYNGGPVTDTDDAGVRPHAPGVLLKKYVGATGSNCLINGMEDDKYVTQDFTFEYCYTIKNMGDECLVGVTLMDPAVGGIASRTVDRLCPDEETTIPGNEASSPTNIPATNATVTATGEKTASEVSSSDPAEVEVPISTPYVSVKKYVGPVGSNCDLGQMDDDTYEADTDGFEYCYIVENTGETECLINLKLTDPAPGGIGEQALAKLCPDDDPIEIIGEPETEYDVHIPPTNAVVDGRGEISGKRASSVDPAEVDFVENIPPGPPQINIEKTVHLGEITVPCFNGQELEYGHSGTVVTYCYEVTNTGLIPLTVDVTDPEVSDQPIGANISLGPGESKFVKKASSILADLNSKGVAVGTPSDNQTPVEDLDDAGVKLISENVCE